MSDKNILVTGFGPFGEHAINASWEAVKLLKNYNIDGYNILTKEVKVVYKHVDYHVPNFWKKYEPLLVVHVGVSTPAKAITLEHQANRAGYVKTDADGNKHPTGEVCPESEGMDLISTKLDVHRICKELQTDKLKFVTSMDAGRFLCEYIYYTSLNKDSTRTLFVHVPVLKSPYSAEELAEGIFGIVNSALKQLNENHS